jgi:hypothetical protein
MDRCLNIPIDLESRTSFRLLEREIVSTAAIPSSVRAHEGAVALVFSMFREFGYAAESERVGFMTEAQARVWADEGTLAMLAMAGGFLVKVEGGYECSLFAVNNQHLGKEYVSPQRMGGLARAAKFHRRAAEEDAVRQAALLQEDLFVTEEGAKMGAEEIQKVTMLIMLLDNCLGRASRLRKEFTAGLIADAHKVVNRYAPESINGFTQWLMANRTKPGVPSVTEAILREPSRYFERFAEAA